jgi:hypothetical protein
MKKLNDIPKKDSFKIPEDYFESFPNELRKKIKIQNTETKHRFITVLKPYLYFAGFFLILAILIKTGVSLLTEDYRNPANPIIANTELESEYYEYDLIPDEMIYDALIGDSINKANSISDETILAYLSQNEIESLIYYE